MANYTVISNLHFNGKPYAPGKTVKIDDEDQAKALLDCGCIAAGKLEKPEKPADPSKPDGNPAAT